MGSDPETAGFRVGGNLQRTVYTILTVCMSCRLQFNHTMIRVKDPQASLKFYTEVR